MEGRKEKQMQNKKPPFTITEKILTDVMEICELVGKVSSTQHLSSDRMRRPWPPRYVRHSSRCNIVRERAVSGQAIG